MKAKIPGPANSPWYLSETTRAIGEIVAAVMAAVMLVLKTKADQSASDAYLVMTIVGLALLAANGVGRVVAAVRKDRETADRRDPLHLLGPLRVLYAVVAKQKQVAPDDNGRHMFRVTLHRHLEATGEHEQVVPYVGGKQLDSKAVVGRAWPNHCGLVGLVVRKGEPKRVQLGPHVDTEAKYVAELVDLYGYTEEQARQLQPMRLDALAIPIKSDGHVVGIVYADSSERNFFDDDIVNLCIQLASAIAQHIESTYTGG